MKNNLLIFLWSLFLFRLVQADVIINPLEDPEEYPGLMLILGGIILAVIIISFIILKKISEKDDN